MKNRIKTILILALSVLIFTSCSGGKGKTGSDSSSSVSSAMSSDISGGTSSASDSSEASDTAVSSSGSAVSSAPPVSNSTPANVSSSAVSKAPVPRATVNVTIPEGYSVSQIGSLLEKKGVCKKSDFLTQVNSYPFTESIMSKIPGDANRCFRLEGYLFPNTYTFYTDMKAQDAIGKMLRSSDTNLYGKYDDQTIIIASIIQMECADSEDMKNVSSVIHNRLNSKMKLQLDATINYIERYVKPVISGDVNRYNSYYNTYKCPGLPEGPICNPGKRALNAAMSPNATDYLYFVADSSGKYMYSKTYIDPKTLG